VGKAFNDALAGFSAAQRGPSKHRTRENSRG
jgi:hypothetical protein